MAIWLIIFVSWPAPAEPHQADHAGVGVDDGPRLVEGGLIAADHDGQHAVLGAGLAAGHRRVEEGEARLARSFVQLARDLGRGGGVVDEDGTLLHRGEGAVGTGGDRAQIIVIADAGEDEVLAFGSLGRRQRQLAAMLGHPLLSLCLGAVIDGDVMAALVSEVPGHRIAHDAKTEKCNRCHKPAFQQNRDFSGGRSRPCEKFVKARSAASTGAGGRSAAIQVFVLCMSFP
jgi:hypothetical protein